MHVQRRALEAAEKRYEIEFARFDSGLSNLLGVLREQERLLTQRYLLYGYQRDYLLACVKLVKALGGGYPKWNEHTSYSPSTEWEKKHRAIWIAIIIFLLLGLAWFIYWFFWGQFYESTDDAYVSGNMVTVTPQVPGIVTAFSVLNTDYVHKGRILVELDKTDAKISLDRAVAELGSAVRDVMRLFETAKQLGATVYQKKAIFTQAARDFEHRKEVIDIGGVSLEDFEHATTHLQSSFADLVATEHAYIAALSQVEGTTVEDHPLVNRAKDRLRDAYVFLSRTTITAPVSGIVAQRTVQVGERVAPGEPILAIVPLDQMWIDANFKEVQLGKMRIGQRADVTVDLYGGGRVFPGRVVGIGGGTGSVFLSYPLKMQRAIGLKLSKGSR